MLDIISIPTPSLKKRSREVSQEELQSSDIQELIKEMIPTMYDDDGIGLAAPQVAQNLRICVIGKEADKQLSEDIVLVNPIWERNSRRTKWEIEGCLSVPNRFGKVKRYTDVTVSAWNEHGEPVEYRAKNFFARVIQHEVDHLDGILFIEKAKDIYEVDPGAKEPAIPV